MKRITRGERTCSRESKTCYKFYWKKLFYNLWGGGLQKRIKVIKGQPPSKCFPFWHENMKRNVCSQLPSEFTHLNQNLL